MKNQSLAVKGFIDSLLPFITQVNGNRRDGRMAYREDRIYIELRMPYGQQVQFDIEYINEKFEDAILVFNSDGSRSFKGHFRDTELGMAVAAAYIQSLKDAPSHCLTQMLYRC